MTDETPTTAEVEWWYAYDDDRAGDDPEKVAAFRRWLAAHDAEVAAKALREVADDLDALAGPGVRASGYVLAGRHIIQRLRDRADQIEQEHHHCRAERDEEDQ